MNDKTVHPSNVLVGILMGSQSDMPVMTKAADVLKEFGVLHDVKILSAHRLPDEVAAYARSAKGRGIKVLIGGAGMAAHLAGALAANSTLPVIGVPLTSQPSVGGVDAILSTVQMPKGRPVATVALDGAANAAYLAIQILALSDETLAKKYEEQRRREQGRLKK
jgi:5-(carboxyamino)imidazole ribonucleotide mutase